MPRKKPPSALRTVGLVMFAILVAFLLFVGAGIAFTPAEKLTFSNTRLAKFVGWAGLSLGIAVLVLQVQQLARILPGILAYAAVGALIVTFTGHLVNRPSMQVSRIEALVATVLLSACCAISLHFRGRRLRLFDRIGLISFVLCLLWAFVTKSTLLPLITGLFTLAIPFFMNRRAAST